MQIDFLTFHVNPIDWIFNFINCVWKQMVVFEWDLLFPLNVIPKLEYSLAIVSSKLLQSS